MDNSKTQDTGNTGKLSRKGTKKQNKLGSFFGKVFSSAKQQKENDKKSNNEESPDQCDLPPVNLDDIKETETLTHFDRPRAPTNRRRPARVAAAKNTRPVEASNLNSISDKDITNASVAECSPSFTDSSKVSSRVSQLPPIPSMKTRPRLLSNAKETKNPSHNSKEESNDISAHQNDRLSQKSIGRSNTEVMLDPPAVPPAKMKPRSNSFSHPENTSFEKVGEFLPRASIIQEEDEDVNGYEIGNKKLSGVTSSTGSKLTKTKSLCVNDVSKASRQTHKKRALTVGSEDIAFTSHDLNKALGKLKNEQVDVDTHITEITKTAMKDTPSQRLSFQGVEYYKCDESRPCTEKQKILHRPNTVDGSEIPRHKDRSSTSSLDSSFNRKSTGAIKHELISRCNTEKGIKEFDVRRESLGQDAVEASNCRTTTGLPPFRQSLDNSNNHSHYCCDETHVASLSRIIYQS